MAQYIGSNTPVNTSSNYTSRWVATGYYISVTGSVFTDQAATLFVEQSGDGVNADVSASYPVVASTGIKFSETVVLPYVRLRLTNASGTNQTVLRLFSRYVAGQMP